MSSPNCSRCGEDVVDDGEACLDPYDGVLRLTKDPEARASQVLGLSLGLAVAVRLDALERRIEQQLEDDRLKMHK